MLPFQLDPTEAYVMLKPLALFVGGMVFYSVFIFNFYKFLAKKDLLALNLHQYNAVEHAFIKKAYHVFLYILEYIIVIPICTFFWFIVLAAMLTFLAKEQTVQSVLLASISVVSAVRVTAYYNEDLSKDLAKMLPFALLGIFIIDTSYFSFTTSIETLKSFPSYWKLLLYYFGFAVLLEFVMRILHMLFGSSTEEEIPKEGDATIN
ncbi:MAG: hypothetical protein ABIF85_04155 [Nanoarchaeota archaeon]|nr:hypothetical protein [Nanoarchaeota archaeon]MBU4452598.1 hypothetical protein [Nanoarchaeota archaeon]MCG2723558.1 hypothetical protein [archaeon]